MVGQGQWADAVGQGRGERSRDVTSGPRPGILVRSLRINGSTIRESHHRVPWRLKFPQTFIKCLPETPGLSRPCGCKPAEREAPAREFWRIVWREKLGRVLPGKGNGGVERDGASLSRTSLTRGLLGCLSTNDRR